MASQSGHEGLVRLLLNSPGVLVDAPTAVHVSEPIFFFTIYCTGAIILQKDKKIVFKKIV